MAVRGHLMAPVHALLLGWRTWCARRTSHSLAGASGSRSTRCSPFGRARAVSDGRSLELRGRHRAAPARRALEPGRTPPARRGGGSRPGSSAPIRRQERRLATSGAGCARTGGPHGARVKRRRGEPSTPGLGPHARRAGRAGRTVARRGRGCQRSFEPPLCSGRATRCERGSRAGARGQRGDEKSRSRRSSTHRMECGGSRGHGGRVPPPARRRRGGAERDSNDAHRARSLVTTFFASSDVAASIAVPMAATTCSMPPLTASRSTVTTPLVSTERSSWS